MRHTITLPIAAAVSLIGVGILRAPHTMRAIAAAVQQTDPAATSVAPVETRAAAPEYGYAYEGPQFSGFVETSYKESPSETRTPFYAWMQTAYDKSGVRFKGMEQERTLAGLLDAVRQRYEAAPDSEAKTLLEKQTGAFCHKLVKKTIRRFSLDHGFEFYNVVDHGQRQCFLQSLLIAAMLQRAGMNAGLAMVALSDKGEESNNGHAVTIIKLSDGHDLLVDASHKTPFIRQQGLMVADRLTGSYRYVAPRYAEDGDQILDYGAMGTDGSVIPTSLVRGLSVAFLRSQFDYYRGERAPGGFFARKKTPEGLADSERFFTRSESEDPGNPLPTYALGRVELRLGRNAEARRQILTAYSLYDRYGHVPQGELEAMGLINGEATEVSMR